MKEKRIFLFLFFALCVVLYLDRVNISVAGPTMMRALAIDHQSFGLILAAFSVGYGIMQFPGGYLADRFGAKRVLVIAILSWSVLTFATGLATTITTLIAVRLLFGLCEGAAAPALYLYITEVFGSKECSRIIGIVGTGVALGPALTAPLVSWILTQSTWEAIFFWTALPGFIVGTCIFFFQPNHRSEPRLENVGRAVARSKEDWKTIFQNRTTWLLITAQFMFNIGYWGYLGWMPSYLVLDRHVNLKELGYGASIPYICGAVGLLVSGTLGSGVMYQRRGLLLAASVLGAAVSLFITFEVSSLVSTVVALSFAAFFLFGNIPAFASLALDLAPPRLRGSFIGVVNTGGQIGGALSPVVVGFLVKRTGTFSSGFVFIECALVVSGIFYLVLSRTMRNTSKILPIPAELVKE